jgi:Tfp pilus assembly major pilin PilA
MGVQVIASRKQQGLSLVGFIFVIAIVALIAVLGMKVVPTVVEYMGVKKAIAAAKNAGSTPAEIRTSFDKQAETGYIDSVSGKDLQIAKTDNGFDVGVAYEKRIALVGPVSLVIDYVAGNGVTQGNKAQQ